ncbi:thioesterase II family protein [Actinokineospora sp. 24-640]
MNVLLRPPTTADWLATLRKADGAARRRLVLFAHAGSGPNELLPAFGWAPPDVEITGIVLPGRERRFRCAFEEVLTDTRAVLDAITTGLCALPPLPTVLFGHSLGAQLAAATAAAEPVSCQGLVLSACPPATPGYEEPPPEETEVLDIISRTDGDAVSAIDHPALRERALRVLRADLALGRRLAAAAARPRVTPVVIGGADDRLVTPAELDVLARQHGAGRPHLLPGGHFSLLGEHNAAAVRRVVGGVLDSVLSAPPAPPQSATPPPLRGRPCL